MKREEWSNERAIQSDRKPLIYREKDVFDSIQSLKHSIPILSCEEHHLKILMDLRCREKTYCNFYCTLEDCNLDNIRWNSKHFIEHKTLWIQSKSSRYLRYKIDLTYSNIILEIIEYKFCNIDDFEFKQVQWKFA